MTSITYENLNQKQLEQFGQNVGFDRIRRITGYLVGTVDKFNDAKRAEERDRVKHGLSDTSSFDK